jgi:XRE family aerobic/anaerobic benzoate catabolism transcriptional regulator
MTEDLAPLGAAVRRARLARNDTIRALAERSGVSERFLSDLERGRGTISIGRLWTVSRSLDVPLAALVAPLDDTPKRRIVALVGLRGAGKTTIGRRVAQALDRPFLELDDRIEEAAGLPLSQIFEIHGDTYYRRLEREVLSSVLGSAGAEGVVVATGGGVVTDRASWNLLRGRATTIWLQADPADHYQRVMAQGDLRPMAEGPQAMDDLKIILESRSALYAKADVEVNTSDKNEAQAFAALLAAIAQQSGPVQALP